MTDANTDNRQGGTEADAFRAGRSAAHNRWLLVIVGAVSALAGLFAIGMPFLASLTAAYVTGGVLIVAGLVGLFTAFRRNDGWHIAAAFALAVLSVVVGVLILAQPIAGILALTTLVIAYFGASGILRIYYGTRMWGDGGGWMLAVGVLSVAVAVLLWFGLPFNAAWVPGVLLGVDLIIWGAVLIGFAMQKGRAPQTGHYHQSGEAYSS